MKKSLAIIFILLMGLTFRCLASENFIDVSTNERTIREFEFNTDKLFEVSDKWAFSNDYDVKLATNTVRLYERRPPCQYLIHIAVTKEAYNKGRIEGWITAPSWVRILSFFVCPREINLSNGWTATWTRKIARIEINELFTKLNQPKML